MQHLELFRAYLHISFYRNKYNPFNYNNLRVRYSKELDDIDALIKSVLTFDDVSELRNKACVLAVNSEIKLPHSFVPPSKVEEILTRNLVIHNKLRELFKTIHTDACSLYPNMKKVQKLRCLCV